MESDIHAILFIPFLSSSVNFLFCILIFSRFHRSSHSTTPLYRKLEILISFVSFTRSLESETFRYLSIKLIIPLDSYLCRVHTLKNSFTVYLSLILTTFYLFHPSTISSICVVSFFGFMFMVLGNSLTDYYLPTKGFQKWMLSVHSLKNVCTLYSGNLEAMKKRIGCSFMLANYYILIVRSRLGDETPFSRALILWETKEVE